jgi:hypothetical protein
MEFLEMKGQKDILVIAVWTEYLTGVYSAEQIASMLEYTDKGPNERKVLRNHYDEYLVEGGIAADKYRILTVFEGGGTERDLSSNGPSIGQQQFPVNFSLEEDRTAHWRI